MSRSERQTLAERLGEGPPLIIDGGMSTALEGLGFRADTSLWTAEALVAAPELIARAHQQFADAGADIAITGSYQVGYATFAAQGWDANTTDRALVASVELARRADAARRNSWVLASMGPYAASVADGSEYTGATSATAADMAAFHVPKLRRLQGASPDAVLFETIPSVVETVAACRAMEITSTAHGDPTTVQPAAPYVLSWTCGPDGRLRSGEPVEDAAAAVIDLAASGTAEVIALGINCTAPVDVAAALDALQPCWGSAIIVYPNLGQVWDADTKQWGGSATSLCEPAVIKDWIDRRVRGIGGCCGAGPNHIAELAKVVSGFHAIDG